eukprot:1703383-Pleurochrysis_carterae.AAC.1
MHGEQPRMLILTVLSRREPVELRHRQRTRLDLSLVRASLGRSRSACAAARSLRPANATCMPPAF